MNKTLFTNGCSWTYGGGLDQPDTREHITHLQDNIVWPAHVQRLMNFDEKVSLAVGGGSNQRICRTTFDWVVNQPKEVLENTVAVIQWSLLDRYEYYVPHPNDSRFTETKATLNDVHLNVKPEFITDRHSLQDKSLSRWAKVSPSSFVSVYENHHSNDVKKIASDRYRTYTDIEGIYTWLSQLSFLHDLFTYHNIEYYYWFFCNEVFAYPQYIQDYMYERFNFLEPERRHMWNYERILDTKPETNDCHPSFKGHEQLAEYIVEAIAKKKTILRRS